MNIREKLLGIEEEVNGIIIGGDGYTYEFWTLNEEFGDHRIARDHFENDIEAMKWFKEKYPDWYAKGVEMRVYDLGRKV